MRRYGISILYIQTCSQFRPLVAPSLYTRPNCSVPPIRILRRPSFCCRVEIYTNLLTHKMNEPNVKKVQCLIPNKFVTYIPGAQCQLRIPQALTRRCCRCHTRARGTLNHFCYTLPSRPIMRIPAQYIDLNSSP